MEAIVLAGGMGTRLRPLTDNLPKPMVDVCGKPFLDHVLSYLNEQGVTTVCLSVGYKREAISDYFGSQYKQIQLRYAVEDAPLGTGGAIKRALPVLTDDSVFVLNGDTLFEVNLSEMWQAHVRTGSVLTIAVKPVPNAARYGAVLLDDTRTIVGFQEKGLPVQATINGGVYLVKREIFAGKPDCFSFEKDLLEKDFRSLMPQAFVSDAYFIDIGIPEDLARARTELIRC